MGRICENLEPKGEGKAGNRDIRPPGRHLSALALTKGREIGRAQVEWVLGVVWGSATLQWPGRKRNHERGKVGSLGHQGEYSHQKEGTSCRNMVKGFRLTLDEDLVGLDLKYFMDREG